MYEEAIARLKAAHDQIMAITISAQDAIQFSSGIIEMRKAISILEEAAKKEESAEAE